MAPSPYDRSCWWDVKHKHNNNKIKLSLWISTFGDYQSAELNVQFLNDLCVFMLVSHKNGRFSTNARQKDNNTVKFLPMIWKVKCDLNFKMLYPSVNFEWNWCINLFKNYWSETSVMLLKKRSDQGLPCLLFWQAFYEFQSWKPTLYLQTDWEKCWNFRTFKWNYFSDLSWWYSSYSFRQASQWMEDPRKEKYCQVCSEPETSSYSPYWWRTSLLWDGPCKSWLTS